MLGVTRVAPNGHQASIAIETCQIRLDDTEQELTIVAWARLRRLGAQRVHRSRDGQGVSHDTGRSFFWVQVVLVSCSRHYHPLQLKVHFLVVSDVWNEGDVVRT
jgi:hypothetical protein